MMMADSSDSSASSASSASWKDEEQVSTGPEQRKQREFQWIMPQVHESPRADTQLDRLDEDWRAYSALQTAFHNPLYEDIDVRVG